MLVYCQKPNCSKFVAADQLAGSRPDLSGSRSNRSVDFFPDNKKEALDRKGFVSQTSCGICGKTIIDDLL